jgi:hypothetical protein
MADSSRAEIEAEIRKAVFEASGERELKTKGRAFTAEVVEHAKIISPFDPDDENVQHYRESFKITARNIRGKLPSWRIRNTSPLVGVIEEGAPDGRPQGGSSPAWHVFTSTAARYGGTPDGVGGAEDEI